MYPPNVESGTFRKKLASRLRRQFAPIRVLASRLKAHSLVSISKRAINSALVSHGLFKEYLIPSAKSFSAKLVKSFSLLSYECSIKSPRSVRECKTPTNVFSNPIALAQNLAPCPLREIYSSFQAQSPIKYCASTPVWSMTS